MLSIDYTVVSGIGDREENQDAFKARRYSVKSNNVYQFAVADGLGGAAGGGFAANLALTSVLTNTLGSPPDNEENADFSSHSWLLKKINITHENIKRIQLQQPYLIKMSTTLVVLTIIKKKLSGLM
ncbi:MAG: protein phosphatase 2C domain-containing protein [Thiolinea sp.]